MKEESKPRNSDMFLAICHHPVGLDDMISNKKNVHLQQEL